MKRSNYGVKKLARLALEEAVDLQGEIILERVSAKCKKPANIIQKAENEITLDEYRKEVEGCKKCPLGKTRIKLVFGEGNPKAELMFVGEGPGYDEDRQGKPFVGRAGQLLTKIIESIGLKREDVFIANIVKCHPLKNPDDSEARGNDRPPSPEEISACYPYLVRQIEIIKPHIICTLGSFSSKTLLATEETISNLRGQFKMFNGIRLMPTFHPAALLRNPNLKKFVWEDMKQIRDELIKFNKSN